MSSLPAASSSLTYRFDRYELRPEAEELRKLGTRVHLQPQPFRALLLLVSRAGRIVTREELQAELWGGNTFVDFEQGLNAVIRHIRFALHDQAETPRFLQTVPRRGYCFMMPVERIELDPFHSMPSPAPAVVLPLPPPDTTRPITTSRHFSRAGLALTLVITAATLFATRGPKTTMTPRLTPPPSTLRISVSPVVFDSDESMLALGGLSAELRNRLAQVHSERIRLAAAHEMSDLRLDTSLWRTGTGFSVDTRLIETGSGRQIWNETFRRSGDVTDFTLEVAARVAGAVIEHYVPPAPDMRPVRSRVSPPALALYRQAQSIRARAIPQGDFDKALELFRRAVELEPGFSEAWSAIADVWTVRAIAWKGSSRQMAIREAHSALDHALRVDPRSAEALNDRALLLMRYGRDYDGAETLLLRSVQSDPDYIDARFNLAMLLSATGRQEAALAEMRRVESLHPSYCVTSTGRAFLYMIGRRYADALTEYRAAQSVGLQHDLFLWEMLSAAIGAGQWDEAARILSSIVGSPIELPREATDRKSEFFKRARQMNAVLATKEHDRLDPYRLACFHAQTGDADRAFAALDRAVAQQSADSMFAFVDPRLDSIRSDRRFAATLVRLGLIRGSL